MADLSTTTATSPDVPRLPPARPLWRVFLAFLGPMILANILQSLSGTLNNVFVGQMLGTRALAAVAGMFPIVFFFISLVIGVGFIASVVGALVVLFLYGLIARRT
jgi:Na+-driven multidrug efflux pump